MKRICSFKGFLFLVKVLFGLDITVSNELYNAQKNNILSNNYLFSSQKNVPKIPLKSKFFHLPSSTRIKDISVEMTNVKVIKFERDFPLTEENIPFSMYKNYVIKKKKFLGKFPSNMINAFSNGMVGRENIGYFSYYCAIYNAETKELIIPQKITFHIELTPEKIDDEVIASDYVLQSINNVMFEENNMLPQPKILYLYPDDFDFSKIKHFLLRLRGKQDIDYFLLSKSEINNYKGNDFQEKTRNAIIDMVNKYKISHVTIIGDEAIFPTRKLFAFDCNFGAFPDENDIPSDMYYSCLNGNWDANQNGIFGEDEDNPDFFPDVFVSRLPLEDIYSYYENLLSYEYGEYSHYLDAGGFSMELWEGSASQEAQEYIYEKYFPNDFSISFLYGNENNVNNAYDLLNQGKNIVQHTGHANQSVLSLEDGHIRIENLDLLENHHQGLFYSIGCWSAAIDRQNIASKLVENGFLGYVGNSRYGWGAPSAPGFGFSEFYQKEFFRLIFENNIRNLADLNALQKIQFIPYLEGASVYKWVAYELNAIGDANFKLIVSSPQRMKYSVEDLSDSKKIIVTNENNIPIEGAKIICYEINDSSQSEDYFITDEQGISFLPRDKQFEIFKEGYQTVYSSYEIFEYVSSDFICHTKIPFQEYYYNYSISNNQSLGNELFFDVEYDSNIFEIISGDSVVVDLGENETVDLLLNIRLKDLSAYITGNNHNINLSLRNSSYQVKFPVEIFYPDLNINQIEYFNQENDSLKVMEFTILNSGKISAKNVKITFTPKDESSLKFQNNIIDLGDLKSFEEKKFLVKYKMQPNGKNVYDVNISYFNQIDFKKKKAMFIPDKMMSFEENFENEENIFSSSNFSNNQWKVVDEGYQSGHSFSCRPHLSGEYFCDTPLLSYKKDLELQFDYKYKMPMYGEDGVFIQIVTDSGIEDLLFLGAGGALERSENEYIYSDWTHYSYNLNDYLLNELEEGESFRLRLMFNSSSIIEGYNDYSTMTDMGIFFDNFKLLRSNDSHRKDEKIISNYKVFPNPISKKNNRYLNVSFDSKIDTKFRLELYNIKGQLIYKSDKQFIRKGKNILFLNLSEINHFSTGIYFLKLKSSKKDAIQKVIFFN